MNFQLEKVHTSTRNVHEAKAWAEIVLDGMWYYVEFANSGCLTVCFNGVKNDPEPIRTLAALRWA